MAYSPKLHEEEIKNKVAADIFGAFDCTRIFGAVDFCVAVKEDGPTLWETESLLWAEAKAGVKPDLAPLFAQLVLTIGKEKTHEKHSPPPFLGAFDCEKIAFLPYHAVVDFFAVNDFDWTVTPSDPSTREFKLLQDRVRPLLAREGVVFRFAEAKELAAFVKKNFVAGRDGTARLPVTRNNFVFVWNRWREAVMPSIAVDWATAKKRGILDADFFLADLLSKDNATLVEKLYVVLRGNHYELDRSLDEMGLFTFKRAEFNDGQTAHAAFWNRYKRPPRREFWHWIAERRDLLVPQDVRERKGSYFTPRIWVEKAQEAIAEALGEDWQDEYDVWDCAAGTGNLLVGLADKYRIWASTLDQADVDVMHERIKNGANLLDSHVFRFDFLNDSFDDPKVPERLRKILQDPKRRRKLVVFINPPYAEADNRRGEGRSGVAVSKIWELYSTQMGYAKRELFVQFLTRIDQELRGCIIAKFGTPKDIAAPKFNVLRQFFQPKLLSMFLVPAWTFDNVKGKFPIAFSILDTSIREPIDVVEAPAYNPNGDLLGTQAIVCYDGKKVINDWVMTFIDQSAPSIGNIIGVANDFQNQDLCRIEPPNRPWNHQFQWQITCNNFLPSVVYFAVRHCMEGTWLNHYDQFLWPADSWMKDRNFQADCLVFTLFHGKNRISSQAGENHWIPFAESEVGAKDAYKSHFMVDWLRGRMAEKHPKRRADTLFDSDSVPKIAAPRAPVVLSATAKAVFDAGRELWRYYHAQPKAMPDASFYDIRAHFQGFNPAGRMHPDSPDAGYAERIASLRAAMKTLASRIAPKVREHGFLR